MTPRLLLPRFRRQRCAATFIRKATQAGLDLLIARTQLSLVELVHLQALLEREQVLLAPVAVQGAGDLGLRRLAALVAMLRQLQGITLAAHAYVKIDNVSWGQIAIGDTVIMVPDAATWPAGLIYMPLRADKAGTIAFDVCNPTNSNVGSPAVNISLWAVKLSP